MPQPTLEPTPALRTVAPALRDRLTELCSTIVTRLEQAVPFYRDAAPSSAGRRPGGSGVDSLPGSVRRNLEDLFGWLQSGGQIELSSARATGRDRAEQGLPLTDTLRGYRIGFAMVWQAVAQRMLGSGRYSTREFADSATVLWWAADEFSSAATKAYRDASAELVEQREQQRAALVEALISGGGMERGALWEIASKLGLPRDGTFISVVAEVAQIGSEALPGIGRRLREEGIGSVWRLLPRLQIGIVSLGEAAPGEPDMADVVVGVLSGLGASARIGVSPAYSELEHTPRAVYLAKVALSSITTPPVEGQPTVQRFAATPLATLIAAAPEAAVQVARSVLGPLLALPRDEQDLLLDTLEVWLATGGSARDTAHRLFCHPNTVRHRLRRIADHTGRSVEHPEQAVELSAALHALRLLPEVR
ncbi:MAG TPA: helix-turn-helix domain-containing protein [Pseudonocardia sp.]|jgi:hypothetical protein|uniref:PucR family transcriptional regulator n=1 Tax=Pseudonocardia sp. TaxID=60912 RepID=UPI002F3EB304